MLAGRAGEIVSRRETPSQCGRVGSPGFCSFWFSMVLVGHGFNNCRASEFFVVSFSFETENLMEEVRRLLSNR